MTSMTPSCLGVSVGEFCKTEVAGPDALAADYSEIEGCSLSGKWYKLGKKTIQPTDESEEVTILVIGWIFELTAGPRLVPSWRAHAE